MTLNLTLSAIVKITIAIIILGLFAYAINQVMSIG